MTQINRNFSDHPSKELKILMILGSIVFSIMLVVVLLFNQTNKNVNLTDPASLVREDSRSLGPMDSPVILVEFLDPECVACGAAYSSTRVILEDFEGQVHYVVRYFPNHANSIMAIATIEAAGEQGMYWEMLDLLFARQSEWVERTTPQTDRFIGYAQELGLDMETFTANLQNPAYVELAERDLQDAQSLSLRGTPTFFVNGQLVYGMQESVIRNLIDEILQTQ